MLLNTHLLTPEHEGSSDAMDHSVPQNIAVLDPSAWLVAFVRMDNAFLGSIVHSPLPPHPSLHSPCHQDIAQKKAKTSVMYNGIPSSGLLERSQPGGDIWGIQETNGGTVTFGGGLPIYDHDGYFIGAVGVSGGTVPEDVDVATAAVVNSGVGKVE
jgi:uncharacterized protein GlcG (DUF336 family)